MNAGVFLTGRRRAEVRKIPQPVPGPGEVLIRVMATGICGSDLHVYRREEGPGSVCGHEPAGCVEQVGPGIVFLKPGDRVSVHHHVANSGHATASGDYVFCPHDHIIGLHRQGSFSQLLVVPERNCLLLPDALSYEDGVFLSCVGSTAYAAIRRLQVSPGETMAVFGLGPVGLSAVLIAKAMGLRVIGVDLSPERIAQGRRCGADEVLAANDPLLVEKIRAFAPAVWERHTPHPGIPAPIHGVHHAVETSGFSSAHEMLIPVLRVYGKAAIVGVGNGAKTLNPEDLAWKAITIFGSLVFPYAWMWDLAEFMVATGMRFTPAVTHRFDFGQISEAFAVADRAAAGKVIVNPNRISGCD